VRPSYRALVEGLRTSGLPTVEAVVPEPASGDGQFLLSSDVQKRITAILTAPTA
jgi:hypothetical protein